MIQYNTCFNAANTASDLIWKAMSLDCVQIICVAFCLLKTILLDIIITLEENGRK